LDECLSDFVFAVLLIAIALSLLAWYSLLGGLGSVRAAIFRRVRRGRVPVPPQDFDLVQQQLAPEFAFDRAIEAYEHLIDSTYAERGQ